MEDILVIIFMIASIVVSILRVATKEKTNNEPVLTASEPAENEKYATTETIVQQPVTHFQQKDIRKKTSIPASPIETPTKESPQEDYHINSIEEVRKSIILGEILQQKYN